MGRPRAFASLPTRKRHTVAQRNFASSSSVEGAWEINLEGITQRIEYQERKRQANISSVAREAARELGEKEVPQHEPDHDWVARFFSDVQDVSSEEMRRIWAQVLAGEVETPGATSVRTLATLRNLSASEAKAFSQFARYRIGNFVYTQSQHEVRRMHVAADGGSRPDSIHSRGRELYSRRKQTRGRSPRARIHACRGSRVVG